MKIHVFKCGSTFVDEALPLSNRSKNPLAFTGLFRKKHHQIEVPVNAFYIEGHNYKILVDTGWDPLVRKDARRYEGFFNYFASPGVLPKGEAVTEHLARLNVRIEDLDYVILTHMDIDHIAGIGLVKNAKKIIVNEKEWEASKAHNPRYLKRLWKNISITTFKDERIDLLGDGSIELIPLHGHSRGMTGVKVIHGDKYVIIAGDSGYARESWEQEVLPGITYNKQEAKASLKQLHTWGTDPNCLGILMAHDDEYINQIISL